MFIYPDDNRIQRVKGFQGRDEQWNEDLERAKNKSDYYEVIFDTASIILFERFIYDCIRKDIDLLFVYTPEYIDGQLFVKNRKEVISLITLFSEKYKIPFFDYSNDTMSFQKKYFYNASHLNENGAKIFSHKLIANIDSCGFK
jgi:hypothetical protein